MLTRDRDALYHPAMTLNASSLKLVGAAILGVLVVAFAAYSFWWWHLAGQVRQTVENFAVERRAAGWDVRWRGLDVSGFPGALQVRLDDPAIVARNGVGWEGSVLSGQVQPWSLERIDFSASGHHRILYGPKPFTVDADEVKGALWSKAGRLSGGEVALFGIAAAGDLNARALYLRVEKRDDWLVRADVEQFDFPPDTRPLLGRRIESGVFQARIKGPIAGVDPVALTTWRDDGGTVVVERLDTVWGPLGVALTGTAALDGNLQPKGSFEGKIQGHDATLDALVNAGMIDPTVANVSKIALGLLAWRAQGKPMLDLPVTVRDRQLYIGPARLFSIPAIDWTRG